MPQWIKDISPFIALVSIIVNIALFLAKRKLELRDKSDKQSLDAELDRQKVSREIAAKLATIFNPYTVEATTTLEAVGKLRMDWGTEGMLVDLVHDEAIGRKLTAIVSTYLDAVTSFTQGNIVAADLHTRRSDSWRQARDVLEAFVRLGSRAGA
jgi:hypothetical protein